jgi:hypothetical protein
MSKKSARKLTLALTLFALTTAGLHASTTPAPVTPTPPVTANGVSGGDPEPTSPNVVQIILALLQLT